GVCQGYRGEYLRYLSSRSISPAGWVERRVARGGKPVGTVGRGPPGTRRVAARGRTVGRGSPDPAHGRTAGLPSPTADHVPQLDPPTRPTAGGGSSPGTGRGRDAPDLRSPHRPGGPGGHAGRRNGRDGGSGPGISTSQRRVL